MATERDALPPRRNERRSRAHVACKRCNAKKVKCNATAQLPCSGCAVTGTECILIDSQRGRYERHRSINGTSQSTLPPPPAIGNATTSLESSSLQSHSGNHVPERNTVPNREVHRDVSYSHAISSESSWNSHDLFQSPRGAESSGMLYAQIAEQGVDQARSPISNTGRSMFLGEAFSLTYVVHDVLAPFLNTSAQYQKRLHFPIAETNQEQSVDGSDRQNNSLKDQTDFLSSRGLLFTPPPFMLDQLLELYFTCFHPAYPLIDKTELLEKIQCGQQSLLIINSILMIAVTICDVEVLTSIGCEDRLTARRRFYLQARALYDADYEKDSIQNICGVFLMSFWWGGPDEDKDSWHWLGIAIGMAQSKGMHRSTLKSNMRSKDSAAWKRIWWSLRIRDVLVAGSIGRPSHIRDSDCDVEMLEVQDITENISEQTLATSYYVLQTAKLCIIFGNIMNSRYAAVPSKSNEWDRQSLEAALTTFRDEIPSILQYRGIDEFSGHGLWPAMLLMASCYCQILLCRPPRSITGQEETQLWGSTPKATAAANEVTRVMEDILSASMGRLCQIHTIPALFNSLAMHVYAMCTSRPVGRELAENRARTCMLGLVSLQECWPVSGWVFQLFASIMNKLKSRIPHSGPALAGRRDIVTEAESRISQKTTPQRPQEPGLLMSSPSDPTPIGDTSWNPLSVPGQEEYTVPNIFMFGDPLEDHHLSQNGFFDSLNIPAWPDVSSSHYYYSQ